MNVVGRIILFLCIVIAGISCLPQGTEKINYLFSQMFSGINIDISQFLPTHNDVADDEDYDEEEYEEDESEEIIVDEDSNAHITAVKPTGTSKVHKNRDAVQKMIGENYLDAVLGSGKLIRWNPRSFPLKVYMNVGANVPDVYVKEVKNAFSAWEKESNGFITFVYTTSMSDANYVCNFSVDLKNRGCDEKGGGVMAYQHFTFKSDGSIDKSYVEFSPYDCFNHPWHPNVFYSTALHEIGHGLGIQGHSPSPRDLMYPVAPNNTNRMRVSNADLTTLRAIYSIIPDVTNIPFNDQDKKKLIKSEDFFGDGTQRAEFAIEQIKENIRITPDMPGLYIELARAYVDAKKYQAAIDSYSQVLKKIDNKDDAVAVLFEVAKLYMELKQYSSAQKCLDKASTYSHDPSLGAGYAYLGYLYRTNNEYSSAVDMLEKSLGYNLPEDLKIEIYKELRYIGSQTRDKVLFDKYDNLLGGR